MGCRGIYFAITDEQRSKLLSLTSDEERLDYYKEAIEIDTEHRFLQETDKAWDAIHRCLGDFPPNTPGFYPQDWPNWSFARPEDHGTYPLKLCVLGGRRLIEDGGDYIIRLIEPNEVEDVAEALEPIDFDWLAKKYWKHCEGAWPEYGEDDLGYTWGYFEEVRYFFRRMAGNGRAVIFAVDQ
jgi:hypothetical protein